jgi:DNA-binding transcriptional ArsR family regulator
MFNSMVEYSEQLDHTFAALADPTRRAILTRLAGGEATVSEIARPFDMSLAAISKHLRVLEQAGLLNRRVVGRVHWLSLNAQPMTAAVEWLAFYQRFWDDSLDALSGLLSEEDHTP